MDFDLDTEQRDLLLNNVVTAIKDFYENTSDNSVAPHLDVHEVKAYISSYFNEEQDDFAAIITHVITGMKKYAVHTPHPRYFGLFNPRSNFPGILADVITAAFNPQLAAWSHAPFAVEVENYLVQFFGEKFGFKKEDIDGVFTTGGAEANLTAILCALNNFFPSYAETGLQGLQQKPVIYCSAESHHSILKSVRVTGLGSQTLRIVPVDDQLRMNVIDLEKQISLDRNAGLFPMMIIATAGTTGTGAIDPLPEIINIATLNQLWLHVDAAYGGGLVLSSKVSLLQGIDKADSITFDAHKWLSVPMGTSMFLTRRRKLLDRTFRTTADYMPKDADGLQVIDPFTHSIQWSRRFNGLKLYMSLLFFGETGYANVIDRQIELGKVLKNAVKQNGWLVLNETELPIVCFVPNSFQSDPEAASYVAHYIVSRGKSWLSTYSINGTTALRACITNYSTKEEDIDLLINELNSALAERAKS